MLVTIGLILIALWVLGLVSSYTMGGFVHVLLILALVSIALHFFRGPRVAV